ncbi:MAG: ATP-dependent DNA helicase RecG, partial [Pseudomonadota bacterium]
VGKSIAERLANLGIHFVQDLLFHLPLRYQDRTNCYPIRSLKPGDHALIEGTLEKISSPKGGRTRLLCQLRDVSGSITLRFFYMSALQQQTFQEGQELQCFGEVRRGTHGLEMIHPEYQLQTENKIVPDTESLTPIYPATEGLSQRTLRKLTDQALRLLMQDSVLQEILPDAVLKQFAFPSLVDALRYVHRPPVDAPVDALLEKQHIAQKRLVFEELLAHRLTLLDLKKTFQIQQAFPLAGTGVLTERFLSALPFALTQAQKRCLAEITVDMQRPHPMLRLVQGDVGSGKTVVAALAMLHALENQTQAVLLAPTELLAEQHFQTFQKWFMPLNMNVVMLSGQLKTAPRRSALEDIASGAANIVIGTHALFQKGVTFNKLALVIVDEQHRFGVQQRALLREKGIHENFYPHQLIMTATPIPRTLAMSVYADLDYSIIDELPPGRTPVVTIVVANSRRAEILERIRAACAQGRQAYWVCTLIEESEVLQCEAAEVTAQTLQQTLPELKIGLLHGRMKSAEKEQIMAAFKQGELNLLVATTVIEVGVDVPNASLMIIENAERLGLAQLHQLRGRVGRGAVASHCVLLYQIPLSQLAKARLNVMRETTDGFKIAERDLQIRGPGEVLGTRQTGEVSLRMADLLRDSDLLPAVSQAADILLDQHSAAIPALIKRWLGTAVKYGQV